MNKLQNCLSILVSSLNKSSKNQRNILTRKSPSSRSLRIEPLERRELLTVDALGSTVFYGPPTFETFMAANEAPIASTSVVNNLSFSARPAGPPTFDEYMASLALVEIESDDVLLDPGSSPDGVAPTVSDRFVVDSVGYASFSEIRARQVFFESLETLGTFDDAENVLVPTDLSEPLLSSEILETQSGGSGGEDPPVWDLEVTGELSSSLSGENNPILERRELGSGGGSDPLLNADYLKVKVPGLPAYYVAEVKFSGSAILGTDYEVYMPNGYSSSYITQNNGFEYSGGATTFYIVPINDAAVEDLETATVRLDNLHVPGSGGNDNPVIFNYDEDDVSVTATIVDDDHWKVNVEAPDAAASERLSDVEQDYGYYTFERTCADVTGDTSYGVDVYFDVLFVPTDPYFCASQITDYSMSVTALGPDDSTVYLQNSYCNHQAEFVIDVA